MIRLAEHVLDWLDVLGSSQIGLPLLLFGERRLASWSTDPDLATPDTPRQAAIRGALSRLFRSIDSPYLAASASSKASPALAGIIAGRKPQPRAKITVPRRLDHLLDPAPPRLNTRLG